MFLSESKDFSSDYSLNIGNGAAPTGACSSPDFVLFTSLRLVVNDLSHLHRENNAGEGKENVQREVA